MKSLAPYFTTFARVSNRLHLKTTRARLLAFVALIALFSTIAVSASSAGSLRQLFASKRAEAQTTKAGGSRASLARQRLTLSAAQSVTRQGQTTTTLKDGRILTTGGRDINGLVVSSVEIFDPANNTFTSFGSLVQARVDHTASLLSDGRVLIAGGSDGANALRSTEIFDPASGFSVSGPQMSAARSGHAANVVHNGDFVLIVGSDGSGEMFNARTGSFSGPSSKSGIGSSISSSSKLSVQSNGGATITTDREDYPPYSTVVISGSGFTPGETVSLVVEQIAPAQATYEPWTTVADENGNILTSWFVFSDELVGATLQATATGQTSGLTASATFTDALAAGVALNGDTNGFNIDGSLRAVTTASPSPTALRTDWLDRLTPTPATGGIVNEDGSPRTPASGPVYLASDPFGNGSSDDVFSGSVKADQNPNTMTWDSTGNNQGKTDLNRVYVHISHDSINDAWVTASADRGSTSGAAYVDFELNQVPVIKNANGTFSSAGPNGGRTANDMLITAQYGGNGTPTLNLFKWELVSGSYVWVDHSNDANIQGKAFAASNSGTLGLPYTSFGSSSYTAGQFVEMSVNVSALVAAGNPCAGIGISTVWVRTKTANSTSANMADFASPISVSFNAGFTATASASPNTYPGTINTSVTGGTGTKSYALTGAGDPQPVTFPNSTGTFTNLAPGSYKVWVKDSPGCVAGSNTVTIVARPITITADNRSKAYGTSLPLGTSGFSVTSGSLNSGDTISAVTLTSTGGLAGSTSAAAGTYVGNIVPSGASGTGNFPAYYNVSYASGDLSITQATANCTVTPYDVPYDGTQKTASGSCTGLSGTVNLTSGLNLTNTQHTNAANYPTDSWSFHDAAGNFADISATTITDNISKVAVTATAGSYGPAPYDGSAHALSACVVTGFAGLSCTNNPTGPVGPDVGSGTVTPDTSSISTTNFTITPVNGNWSITQVAVTATAGSYSGVYDGTTHALSACAVTGYAGLSCTNSPTGPVGPNVGSGVVTPDTSGISTTNFIITPVNGNWSITQATASCTVTPYDVPYDGTQKTASGSCTGLSGTVNLTSGLNLTNTQHTNAANYPTDSWSFHDAAGNFADISATTITDNISKVAVTATAGSYSGAYDGNTHALSACVVTGFAGLSCTNSPTGPVGPDAGSGVVTPDTSTISTTNFTITPVNGSWSITKVAVTATAGSYGPAPYDGSTHALSACVVTGYAGLSCTNNPTGPVGPDAGSGVVTPDTSGISTTNFTITPVNGNWSITKVAVTATAGSYGPAPYDGSTHALSACVVTGYTGLSCTNSPTGPVGPDAGSGVVTPDTSTISTTNFTITPVNGSWSITRVAVDATAGSYSGVYDGNTHALSACVVTGYAGLSCTNSPTGPVGAGVGSGVVTPDTSSISTTNFTVTPHNGSYSITKAPTLITFNGPLSNEDFLCGAQGTYTATLKDTYNNVPLSGISLTLTIGSQTASGTTNSSGVATFSLVLNQAPGSPGETVGLTNAWTDPNRSAPPTQSGPFTVLPDSNVGPGANSGALYTGPAFAWTTSPTSSTTTLTLNATIKDTSETCAGDITKAKVSFFVSSNNGSSFSPVSNAQNLPVGLVNPLDKTVGTASTTSQFNIGSNLAISMIIRVVVGGEYVYNAADYDVPVVIAKPGQPNMLTAGGTLTNTAATGVTGAAFPVPGADYYANGYLGNGNGTTGGGLGVGAVSFAGSVQCNNTKCTNPQGQLNANLSSYNKPDGTNDYPHVHHYFMKTNAISGWGTTSAGSGFFSAKTNLFETTGGASNGLDGGGMMQMIFANKGATYTYQSTTNNKTSVTLTCPMSATNGCASIIIYRSNGLGGGVWFSSAWGPVAAGDLPQTIMKTLTGGTIAYAGAGGTLGAPVQGAPTTGSALGSGDESITPVPTASTTTTSNVASTTNFVGAVVTSGYTPTTNVQPSNNVVTNANSARRLFIGRADSDSSDREIAFAADGLVGKNWVLSNFENSVESITNGVTPDGRVTVTVRTCNRSDGSRDLRCVATKPSTQHVYVFETNVLAEASLVADIANLNATAVVYELLANGEKKTLDKDVAMQIVFVPENQMLPLTIGAAGGSACTDKAGCAAIAVRKADGSLWYSGGWRLTGREQ